MAGQDHKLLNKLVDLLLECASMSDESIRGDILRELPGDLYGAIKRRSGARADVRSIAKTCQQYPQGLTTLLEIVRAYEGNSLPLQAVEAFVQQQPEIVNPQSSENSAWAQKSSARVFISYRHTSPDEDLANFLVDFLNRQGHRAFIDNQMLVGTKWVKDIEAHIKTADAFVVLISKDSILSAMVKQEVALAHKTAETRGDGYQILPIRVDYRGELPADLGNILNRYHYAHWEKNAPHEIVAQQIARALNRHNNLPFSEISAQSDELNGLKTLQAVTDNSGAPLPQADPRLIYDLPLETGTLKPASPFYVERETDREMDQQLALSGSTILVKGARQMGKSSLLARAHAMAKEQGKRTFYLDFQTLDAAHMATLEKLLQYIARRIHRGLRLSMKPGECWDNSLGAKDNLTYYLEDAVLDGHAEQSTLLLFDEVDQVFKYDYRDDFFGMMRFWHNNRALDERWENLNIILAHSTEPTLWIQNIEQSPFNVGYNIRMENFAASQVERLNKLHHYPLKSAEEIEELLSLVGGQPFLVRQALYCMVKGDLSLEALKKQAKEENGPFGDHLRHFLWKFQEFPAVQQSFREILYERPCINEIHFQRLRAAGLVKGATRDTVSVSCRLYQDYFKKHL